MTNEVQSVAPQIASGIFDLLWPIALKYGVGILGVFLAIWWAKKVFHFSAHTKQIVIPVLALALGLVARFMVIAGEIVSGGQVPIMSKWYLSLEVFRGLGVGMAASLFQMLYGWKVEKWLDSKFPKRG